jgi:hypothetical protein
MELIKRQDEIEINFFCTVVSKILEEIVEETEKSLEQECKRNTNTTFNAKKSPIIKIEDYLKRILLLSKCEENTIIHSLILIDELCEKNDLYLTKMNYHRILLTSIVISIKYLEDVFFSNQFYGKIGGIKLEEINDLEIEFLKLISFNVYTKEENFTKYKESIFKQTEELKKELIDTNDEDSLDNLSD